jgi:hypothetical protein
VVTVGTIGVGGAFRAAQFGHLNGVKNIPVVKLPKFISRSGAEAMERAQTKAWKDLGSKAQVFKVMGWALPSGAAKVASKDYTREDFKTIDPYITMLSTGIR